MSDDNTARYWRDYNKQKIINRLGESVDITLRSVDHTSLGIGNAVCQTLRDVGIALVDAIFTFQNTGPK